MISEVSKGVISPWILKSFNESNGTDEEDIINIHERNIKSELMKDISEDCSKSWNRTHVNIRREEQNLMRMKESI